MTTAAPIVRVFEHYSELGDPPVNLWQYETILAVGPKGQLAIRHLSPGRLGEVGDVPIRALDGVPVLHPRYARQGWVLYEDLCKGRVPGIEADLEAWERWQTLRALLAKSAPIPAGKLGDDLFHDEVVRRRRDGGPPMLTVAELRTLFPGATIAEEADEELERAAKSKG